MPNIYVYILAKRHVRQFVQEHLNKSFEQDVFCDTRFQKLNFLAL